MKEIDGVFNMVGDVWTVKMVNGRQFDLYDKEMDMLTEPADIATIKRYREWREDSIARAETGAIQAGTHPSAPPRSPTPMPWLRRMFYGLF